jgi:hypothetical protein
VGKVIFSGCSFTAGDGWVDITRKSDKNSPYLWVNLCHSRIQKLKDLELVNVGQSGASNVEIFQNTMRAMTARSGNIDTIFCQWTSMPRYNFNVGLELWSTSEDFFDNRLHDVKLNNGNSWSREYIRDLTDRLLVMHHLHWEIVKVVDFSNIILNTAYVLGIENVFFVNGMCPWDNNYFVELHNVKPESYTPFTKKEILDIDNRDDEDIYKLYSLIHQHYRDAGGINTSNWVSLNQSFFKQITDTNYDKFHPGIQSNELYYQIIEQRLKELNFI